jgi:serine protease Do
LRGAKLLLLVLTVACGDASSQDLAATHSSYVTLSAHRAALQDSITLGRNSAIVEAAARVAPSVVSVNVVRRERRAPRLAFDFFFLPRPYERLVEGLGSGFIISSDGVVITNQHVVAGAEEIVVTTREGVDYPARLLGEDPLTDVAVLKIEGTSFPTVRIGQSHDLAIGEWVVAVGNPYGYLLGNTEPSVTAGVVSALGRNLLTSGDEGTVYVRMIQTDAAINPGNSGGPLANALGEVVGVNSSIFSSSGGSVGIGFAIPVERALHVTDELRLHGEVRRAWVGLDVAGADRLREWKRIGGLEVTSVAEGSPAARAGLAAGDILLSAGALPLRTYLDWEAVKLEVAPGDSLVIRYRRGDRDARATIRVEALPTSRAERMSVLGDIELVTVTPAVRQERSLAVERGALIVQIGSRTQGATSLQVGDVILQINRTAVSSADDVRQAFRTAQGGSPLRVFFARGGARGFTDFYVR